MIQKSLNVNQALDYKECCRTTFGLHNAKKFREWCEPHISDIKANDEMVKILGYLAWDFIGILTIVAGIIRRDADNKPYAVCYTDTYFCLFLFLKNLYMLKAPY